MEPLIAASRRVPDDHVVRPVSCRYPGRAPPVLTLAPGKHDRRWICRSNFVGPDRTKIVMKTNVCSLTGVVSHSRRASVDPADTRLVRRPRDPTEIVAVEQISIAIFA